MQTVEMVLLPLMEVNSAAIFIKESNVLATFVSSIIRYLSSRLTMEKEVGIILLLY
jgi:hypothetical protein